MAGKGQLIISYASGDVARPRKLGAVGSAVFMAAALVPLAWFVIGPDGPFLYVISGQLFVAEFDRSHVGSALDQPTIGKWFMIFAVFSAMALPYVAAGRWISDRRTRPGYWAFAGPAIAVCVCLLTVLAMPFYWLLQYIDAMGFTRMRILGLIGGLSAYMTILGFLCWALWAPNGKDGSVAPTKAPATQQ